MKKKNISNIKIFIAGHNGMVGMAIHSLLKKKKFKKIITITRAKLDLENKDEVENFIKIQKPKVIINCAGKVGGILANSTFPVEFLYRNISIQLNLLSAAFKNNIKHFINLGSSCIYPKNSKQPIKEEYLLTSQLEKTNEAYALAKIIGLKGCEYYNLQHKTNYLTLMPCNLYGPNDNFDKNNSHFIPALIKKFVEASINKKKQHVEIWGSGKPKREIMHVNDLASAVLFILKKKINNNQKLLNLIKKNPVINIGSGQEHTIKNYAKIINKISGAKKKLFFNKKYPDGTFRKFLDNTVISDLGWKASISLTEGLSQVISWYKNKKN